MIQHDMYIEYGDVKHSGEFQRLHPKAKEVAYVASFLAKAVFNETLITTSIFRKKTSDSGIHEAFRAIDFKPMSHITYTYRLIAMLNAIYTYDEDRPDKKVAHTNPFHGTAPHLHIQVHDHTSGISKAQNLELLALASKDQANFKPQVLA